MDYIDILAYLIVSLITFGTILLVITMVLLQNLQISAKTLFF